MQPSWLRAFETARDGEIERVGDWQHVYALLDEPLEQLVLSPTGPQPSSSSPCRL
jgi:hypothetical protein